MAHTLNEEDRGVRGRLRWRARWVAVRGIAAALAGVVVLGVGGRLVMLASRLLHPDARGLVTENGNIIGEFTLRGTATVIVFSGLVNGLFAGVVWAAIREWIPTRPLAIGAGAMAIGGSQLIEADNRDFVILQPPWPDVVLLVGLLFAFGVAVCHVDRFLDGRLPPARSGRSIVGYSLVAVVGVLLVVPASRFFFSRDFCMCQDPPMWTGTFLAVAAVASLTWWVMHLRGRDLPPTILRIVGGAAVVLAVAVGGAQLALEVVTIL